MAREEARDLQLPIGQVDVAQLGPFDGLARHTVGEDGVQDVVEIVAPRQYGGRTAPDQASAVDVLRVVCDHHRTGSRCAQSPHLESGGNVVVELRSDHHHVGDGTDA